MFTVGVVMPSHLASKVLICREIFCEFVPLLPFEHDCGCLQLPYDGLFGNLYNFT